MKKMPRQILWGILFVSVMMVCLVGFLVFRSHTAKAPSQTTSAQKTTSKSSSSKQTSPEKTLRFVAMGDMLAHDTVNQQAKRGDTYDYKPYFSFIRPLYKDADAVFCNPETLVAGQAYDISGYPAFNAPTEFARDLASPDGAGCNVINLASNHINDKGQAAINATLDQWDALKPLAYAGANRTEVEQQSVHYFEKNGVKVAFLAFADYSNNTNLTSYGLNSYHNNALVTDLMTKARANADAVVVSMHWGTEDTTKPNPDQQAAAQNLASLGADVVIGTGPHMLQKVTYLTSKDARKTLVWYSIGNMLSSQLKIDELTGGIAGFTLVKNTKGTVVSDPTFTPTFMSYRWSAADKAAQNLLARSDLRLQPLNDAGARITEMFGPEYSVFERQSFIKDTLSADTDVEIAR